MIKDEKRAHKRGLRSVAFIALCAGIALMCLGQMVKVKYNKVLNLGDEVLNADSEDNISGDMARWLLYESLKMSILGENVIAEDLCLRSVFFDSNTVKCRKYLESSLDRKIAMLKYTAQSNLESGREWAANELMEKILKIQEKR